MKLFIDTATNEIKIGLIKDQQVVTEKEVISKNDVTNILYSVVEEIVGFDQLSNLSAIYVINGPGSFTGVRIGVLFAKTLSHEYDIKLYPLNRLKVLYSSFQQPVAMDARGKKYFVYDGQTFKINHVDEMENQQFVIDGQYDLQTIVNEKLFEQVQPVSSLELTVDYMKDVL